LLEERLAGLLREKDELRLDLRLEADNVRDLRAEGCGLRVEG
jgi:hypothetical protein